MSQSKKILLVAMLDSVHTARWLGQFENDDMEFVLFPSTPNRRLHKQLKGYLGQSSNMNLTIPYGLRFLALPIWLMDILCLGTIRKRMIRSLCHRHKFDFSHALETQHSGYLLGSSLTKLAAPPKFILTLWGSDLNWFHQQSRHKPRIIRVLNSVNLLSTECMRDQRLARDLGFRGDFLPQIPASGGMTHHGQVSLPIPSNRNAIAVKGYSGFVGMSLAALAALERNRELLEKYEIHVYSASLRTRLECLKLRRRTKLVIHCYKKKSLTVQQIIQIFSQCRISLAMSLSDGFPGSQREAMSVGCFPIESCGSCASEWVQDSSHIMIIDPLDPLSIDNALIESLTNDALVDRAGIANQRYVAQNLSFSDVSVLARTFYSPYTHNRNGL